MINRQSRRRFNKLFKTPKILVDKFISWRPIYQTRAEQDPDSAWRFGGEFGVIADMQFERHLIEIFSRRNSCQ